MTGWESTLAGSNFRGTAVRGRRPWLFHASPVGMIRLASGVQAPRVPAHDSAYVLYHLAEAHRKLCAYSGNHEGRTSPLPAPHPHPWRSYVFAKEKHHNRQENLRQPGQRQALRGPSHGRRKLQRLRAANTRHGLYSQAEAVALASLGEDPAEFETLRQNLYAHSQPAFWSGSWLTSWRALFVASAPTGRRRAMPCGRQGKSTTAGTSASTRALCG